jgi:hypothetical protein
MDLTHGSHTGPRHVTEPQQRPDTWQHPITRHRSPVISLAPNGASTHGFPPAARAEPHMRVSLSSVHDQSPIRHRIRGSSPSSSCGTSGRITSHPVGPRWSEPLSRVLAGAGLGGTGPFLAGRHVSATVPRGHHPPRIRQIGQRRSADCLTRWLPLRPPARASARRPRAPSLASQISRAPPAACAPAPRWRCA